MTAAAGRPDAGLAGTRRAWGRPGPEPTERSTTTTSPQCIQGPCASPLLALAAGDRLAEAPSFVVLGLGLRLLRQRRVDGERARRQAEPVGNLTGRDVGRRALRRRLRLGQH